jgi:uncharacterized sporulation protein YeaH/YhbH (DUF444 family)
VVEFEDETSPGIEEKVEGDQPKETKDKIESSPGTEGGVENVKSNKTANNAEHQDDYERVLRTLNLFERLFTN